MNDRVKLSVLPYREVPADIEYGLREVANCKWCRWENDPYCEHPQQRYVMRGEVIDVSRRSPGLCSDWNHDGLCRVYETTRFTRLLRFFGLRRPARSISGT